MFREMGPCSVFTDLSPEHSLSCVSQISVSTNMRVTSNLLNHLVWPITCRITYNFQNIREEVEECSSEWLVNIDPVFVFESQVMS